MPLVDEETRTDVLDYFPVITNKKIYYQLLTQHIDYHDAQQNQTFQHDIFFLNKSSLEWRVPLTVQKRLGQMDTDWNRLPSTLHEMPNIYLQDLALFLDDSTKLSRLLYRANIDLSTWHWREKSKCFPLIDTTEDHLLFLCHPEQECQAIAADKTRKATFSRRGARKLASFDTNATTTTSDTDDTVNKHNHTPPDYGREISTATNPTTAETPANGNLHNNATRYRPPEGRFLPHLEIDDFIKQKKQVSYNNTRHEYDA